MKLPWQKSESSQEQGSTPASQLSDLESTSTSGGARTSDERPLPKGYTPPKGKPTPTRREREIERGVVRDPNQLSTAQAGKRRKELKSSMSKEEWKEYKRKEREETRERNRVYQERLQSGDERYLLDRDRGAERRYVRDWIDSKRFFCNLFMPFALVMILTMFITSWAPQLANVLTGIMMVAIILFFVEGFMIGRRVNAAVRTKYPDSTETGARLGFYAFSRATQPRRWRTPRPQVEIGDAV